MAFEETSILFISGINNLRLTEFPKRFKKGLASRFDRRFCAILVFCALLIALPVYLLSLRQVPHEVSQKEILRIQERYAQLVLKQPPPKPLEEEKSVDHGKAEGTKTQEKEKVKIDRTKESFADRQKRKEDASEERRKKRQAIAQEVVQSGIFAAITAAATSSGTQGSSNVTDLLGAVNAADNLGNINITKGTFATKKVGADVLEARRRGTTTTAVDIERSRIGRAEGTQFASSGAVNIKASGEAQISGNEGVAAGASRSQASILAHINKEISRLKRLYEYWLKKDPTLSGQLKIKFTILPSGDVANASIITSTTKNQEFDQAILRYIKNWKFPPEPGGNPVEVVYPFVFESQE